MPFYGKRVRWAARDADDPLPSVGACRRALRWLSFWLSRRWKLAGMDGNRTHPGRLNSAPQTVLKTAGDTCWLLVGWDEASYPKVHPQPTRPCFVAIFVQDLLDTWVFFAATSCQHQPGGKLNPQTSNCTLPLVC